MKVDTQKVWVSTFCTLNRLADKKEEQKSQAVFHTDQGAVYSSRAFCRAHEHYNILRSMPRGGTPTDNPIIEALDGWIKEKLYLDYGIAHARTFQICLIGMSISSKTQ